MSTLKENAGKWMDLFNTVVNVFQLTSDTAKKVGAVTEKSDTKKDDIKKPGFLSWFTNADERVWAEIFYALLDSDQNCIVQFLDDLPPCSANSFSESVAKKINQAIFRKLVVGLNVEDLQTLKKTTETGSGEKKKIEKEYDSSRKDHRVEFLKWIAQNVRTSSTAETRKALSVANIIISDESMQQKMQFISRIVASAPELYAEVNVAITKSNEGLRVYNLFTGLLILPTLFGSYHLWQTGQPTLAIALICIAGVIGFFGIRNYRRN